VLQVQAILSRPAKSHLPHRGSERQRTTKGLSVHIDLRPKGGVGSAEEEQEETNGSLSNLFESGSHTKRKGGGQQGDSYDGEKFVKVRDEL